MDDLIEEVEDILTSGANAPFVPSTETLPPIPVKGPIERQTIDRETGPLEEAVATPGVRRPGLAVRVARFPQRVGRVNAVDFQQNTDVLGNNFIAPATGVLRVQGFITSTSTATTLSITWDGGQNYATANEGATLIPGAVFTQDFEVTELDEVNFQFNGNVTATMRITFREGD